MVGFLVEAAESVGPAVSTLITAARVCILKLLAYLFQKNTFENKWDYLTGQELAGSVLSVTEAVKKVLQSVEAIQTHTPSSSEEQYDVCHKLLFTYNLHSSKIA